MVSRIFKSRRGAIFSTLDTLIAGLIIVVTLILVLSIYTSRPVVEDTYHDLSNYMNFLTSTTMRAVRDNYDTAYQNPHEQDLDLYIYQKVYKLYLEDNLDEARSLVGNLSTIIIPAHMGFRYDVADETIFSMNTQRYSVATTSVTNRLLTFVVNDTGSVHITTTNITVWS